MIKLADILKQLLLEEKTKRDRCLRIADRKYDKPSAYKSAAAERCRQGDIWKDLKEFKGDSNPLKLKYIDTWHDSQYKANDGKTEEAIKLMTQAAAEAEKMAKEKQDGGMAGEANYYKGTVAWLKKDYSTVEKYINDKFVKATGNDEVLKRLLNNKDKSYKEAYHLNEEKTKRDRCLRIADRKFDKPSAYKSGAVVRCRQGKIWKGIKENKEEFQNRALDKINKVGGFNNLPDIDKLALLGGSGDAQLKNLSLSKIFEENGGTFGKLEIKIKVKDKNNQPVEHKFSQEFAGKEGYLFPYIHYDDDNQPYVIVRFDEFTSDPNLKGGGSYKRLPIMLDNIFPIDYDKIKSDFVQYQNKVDFDRNEFLKSFGLDDLDEGESLHKWFKRQGTPGKEGGWVDCNTCRDGKCKACGRKKGEKRAKYPSCRPTPAQCKSPGKGKKWGKTK